MGQSGASFSQVVAKLWRLVAAGNYTLAPTRESNRYACNTIPEYQRWKPYHGCSIQLTLPKIAAGLVWRLACSFAWQNSGRRALSCETRMAKQGYVIGSADAFCCGCREENSRFAEILARLTRPTRKGFPPKCSALHKAEDGANAVGPYLLWVSFGTVPG